MSVGLHGRRPTRRALLGAGVATSATWLLRKPARASSAAPIVVDVHAHNFNESDLPVTGFAARFVPFLSDFSREISTLPEELFRKVVGEVRAAIRLVCPTAQVELQSLAGMSGWPAAVGNSTEADKAAASVASTTTWLAHLVGAKADPGTILKRAAQVIYLIAHGRADVTATLAADYPEVSLFIPMLVDYDQWVGKDKAGSSLGDQIAVHGALAKRSIKTPVGPGGARLHPFVAFDPARADGLELVKMAIETAGFVGVKVYPPVGFAPARNACLLADKAKGQQLDDALFALYAYCAKKDVPITTHCSSGNEFGLGFRDLVAPHRWGPVLEKFPTLRLNLGHVGHMDGVDPKRGFAACEAWLRQAASLMDTYKNVYGDLSGSDFNLDGTAAAYARLVRQAITKYKSVPKRLMYGSDSWLNRFFDGAPEYLTKFEASFKAQFPDDKDLFADVIGRNALRFLGFAKDGGRAANGERLASLYHASGVALPPWLDG